MADVYERYTLYYFFFFKSYFNMADIKLFRGMAAKFSIKADRESTSMPPNNEKSFCNTFHKKSKALAHLTIV